MPFKEDGMGTILGIIVNIFSMVSDISQIFHTINHQSVEGISIISIIFVLGGILTAIQHIWRLYKFKTNPK